MHNLNLQELHKKQLDIREYMKAEMRAYIQKLDMFIEHYDEFNELPDKEFTLGAKNSVKNLKDYIEKIM